MPGPRAHSSRSFYRWRIVAVGVVSAMFVALVMAGGARAQDAGVPQPTTDTFMISFVLAETDQVDGPRELTGGVITVFADGEQCARLVFSEQTDSLVIGGSVQPAVCSRDGAELTFANAKGQRLFETLTLRKGDAATFANFAPVPPNTSGGALHPPNVGSGLLSGSGWPWPGYGVATLLALTGALLLAARLAGRRERP